MIYVLLGGIALLAAAAAYQGLSKIGPRKRMQWLRWGTAGVAAAIAAVLMFARRMDLALFVGAAAIAIVRTGRIGPFSFESKETEEDNASKVRSHYFKMTLDHGSGAVSGVVRAGQFAGVDLIDLGEMETRALMAEIEGDPDSMSLLESWLDANRRGWREYFEQTAQGYAAPPQAPVDDLAKAYAVLGLTQGASAEDIKAAHRELMKGVHPDHGGSSYLASQINAARDLLLARMS
jgi:hypothetical protein